MTTDDRDRAKSTFDFRLPTSDLRQRKAQLGFGLGFGGGFFDTIAVPAVIIGVLGFVAFYAYGNYRAKARISEELAAVGAPAKAAVEKAFIVRGPADMSRRQNSGWIRPAFRPHLQSADIARDGTITLRFTNDVMPQAENQIQIVPVSSGRALDLSQPVNAGLKFEWQCGGPAGKTTVPEKYLPRECRTAR